MNRLIMIHDMQDFDVQLSPNGCVSIIKTTASAKVYRVPYQVLKDKAIDFDTGSDFIVYILVGKNPEGEDCVYVGKSTGGIYGRPLQHPKKAVWNHCYIITDNVRFLNDATIQYIEHKVSSRINDLGTFVNTTSLTNSGTANDRDKRLANEFLDRAYQLLYVMGFDIMEENTQTPVKSPVPSSKPVTEENSDQLDTLNLNDNLRSLLCYLRSNMLSTFSNVTAVANGGQWNYLRFSFVGRKKTLVYCKALKKQNLIKAYIQGVPEYFDDPYVVFTDNPVYGDCKSLFIVEDVSDAEKLIGLCKIAYSRMPGL